MKVLVSLIGFGANGAESLPDNPRGLSVDHIVLTEPSKVVEDDLQPACRGLFPALGGLANQAPEIVGDEALTPRCCVADTVEHLKHLEVRVMGGELS